MSPLRVFHSEYAFIKMFQLSHDGVANQLLNHAHEEISSVELELKDVKMAPGIFIKINAIIEYRICLFALDN
ncbi:MAG: hypothetical protein ACPHY8_00620 [Patescibacteria group bacterium]